MSNIGFPFFFGFHIAYVFTKRVIVYQAVKIFHKRGLQGGGKR